MPKQRITKEMIVEAAYGLAREGGMEQVTVKSIAARLACSVQPIYSYCRNMEGLRQEIVKRIRDFVRDYVASHADKTDLFHSTGQAYLQIAREEPHLFRIFVLHQREGISSLTQLYQSEANLQMEFWIARELAVTKEQARQLHLNMLIYTIGLGTVFSVTRPGISIDEIFAQQDIAYEAFLEQVRKDEG